MIEITKKENLPHRIMVKIRAVNAEDPCYVADELVELAEEGQQKALRGTGPFMKDALLGLRIAVTNSEFVSDEETITYDTCRRGSNLYVRI